jgi:hypothetical protein
MDLGVFHPLNLGIFAFSDPVSNFYYKQLPFEKRGYLGLLV